MKKLFTIILLLAISSYGYSQTFTLSSKDLGGQATSIEEFNGFGCTGKNQSPQLSWDNAPEGTKSFAITMYDPDAPTGSGWWHWVMFDIPADTKELATNAGNLEMNLAPYEFHSKHYQLRCGRVWRTLPSRRPWPSSICNHRFRFESG